MRLTVVYEHWHLGDGNYPAFTLGDEVRLSFELDVTAAETVSDDTPLLFRQDRDAHYDATARVIRRYGDGISDTFPVFDAGDFRFYSPSWCTAGLPVGAVVRLQGRLALDHYLWVEFLDRYPDPPELFYNLRVVRIRTIVIPDRFIHRGARSLRYPTALSPTQYGDAAWRDAQRVEEHESGPSFSLVDFEELPPGSGPENPTFL
ncbi:MAG TPA: hypothetical protein DCM87_02265 [Planctomycetes bacterium]|nr:hypothetical protein [Planctomycetota bacterium]